MSTEEDLKRAREEEDAAEEAGEPEPTLDTDAKDLDRASETDKPGALVKLGRVKSDDEIEAEKAGAIDDAAREAAASPMQLGYMRFVYAAYMAGAILIAFLVARGSQSAWNKLAQYKPELGEPGDMGTYGIYAFAVVVGVGVSFYYWQKRSARQYAIEVAEELSKVTWPNRKEVVNSTTVVLFYTVFATVFFALMDQFWKYVTDKIYSF